MPPITKTKKMKPSKAPIPALPKPAKKYVSSKISLEALNSEFYRADLIFDGVDHSGVSYEGRVFLNNESANEDTPKTGDQGYAGVFHIFGHGGCFGDAGHCEVGGTPRLYDPRPAHPLTPARKVLIATEAVQKVLTQRKQMTVTVVPIVYAGTAKCDFENVLKFNKISVRTYS
jgi:hypothetical protein